MGIARPRVTGDQESQLIAALNATDWDFHDSVGDADAHSIHPFPAKFIPQIPRKILSLFDVPPDTAVLDPFAGSGTTLLEAQSAGHNFVGIDLNPIAALICRVKTAGVPSGALDFARQVAGSARTALKGKRFLLPEIPRLEHWFRPEVSEAMACIVREIDGLSCSEQAKDFLRLALSAITVRVSNQDSETRYAAIPKQIGEADVFRLFARSADSIALKLQRSNTLFSESRQRGRIIREDARRIADLQLPPISLVITSPPYPNAFEYWLYNKYRMYWLGFDPIFVREHEIGARPHYSCNNGESIEDFLSQMATVFEGISKHLIDNAAIAVVIGSECRIRGGVFDVPTALDRTLVDIGYDPLTSVQRRIPRTRKAFNPEIGSIESETLLFMRWRRK